jgi:four helix bundle protein
MGLQGFRDLIVYKKSYKLALDIFNLTKEFPHEEKFSLTDQIRRSSRSIPANIAESWAKRLYVKAFTNKISDALGEEYETEVWLNMACDMHYISSSKHDVILSEYDEIRRMLISILKSPEKFCK